MSAIVDVTAVLLITASGWTILRSLGATRATAVLASTIVGYGLFMAFVLGALLLNLAQPAFIAAALTPLTAVGVLIAVASRRPNGSRPVALAEAGVTVAGIALLLVIVRVVVDPIHFVRHTDSIQYLILGHLMLGDAGELSSEVNLLQLKKRLLGAPSMHTLQTTTSQMMSLVATPWTAILTAGAVFSTVWRFGTGLTQSARLLIASVTVAGLLSSTRFVMHATYLNSHLFVGLALSVSCAVTSLACIDNRLRSTAPVIFVAASAVMVFSRAEGFLIAMLALVAIAGLPWVTDRQRRSATMALGLQVTAWNAFQVLAHHRQHTGVLDREIALPLILGVSLIVFSMSPGPRRVVELTSTNTRFAVLTAAVVVAPIAFAATQADVAYKIIESWWYNFFAPGTNWAFSLWLLVPTVVLAAIALNDKAFRPLWFPVVTYPSLGLFLGLVRGAGRAADADSFNRMMMQVYPSMVMLIGVAAALRLRLSRMSPR